MGKWKELFEKSLVPFEERSFGELYEFGPPATSEQISAAAQSLGVSIPTDLREMLSEFNGIWYTTNMGRKHNSPPEIAFLDLEHIAESVPGYLSETDNIVPAADEWKKVVFFCQCNGFGELWGICVDEVAGNLPGTVVKLDHEIGEFEAAEANLSDFIRNYSRSMIFPITKK